jgi:hypothetical protein
LAAPLKENLGRKIERDVWLSDAIERAFWGQWQRGVADLWPGIGLESSQRLHDIAVKDIRQLAFEGKLPVLGKRSTSDLWEAVPREFQVSFLSTLLDDPSKLLIEHAMFTGQRVDDWQELMTSWQAVEYLWPAVPQSDGGT